MVSNPFNVAIVGLGRWGNMLAGIIRDTSELRLLSCCSRAPEKRAAFSEKFGCGQEESYEALLEREDLDGVIITVPNHLHTDFAVAAAAKGKHVFVDKPIAITILDARAMIDACEKGGVVLAVGASSRRLRGHRVCKEIIEKGEIGTVSMAEANFSNDRGIKYTEDDWQWYEEGCPGGPLMQIGIHHLDNLFYLFGPVRRVSAAFSKIMTKSEIPDVCTLWLEFESGVLGTLGTSFVSPRLEKHWTYFLNVYGSKATLCHDRWEGIHLYRPDKAEKESISYEEYPGFDYLREELIDFADAAREKRAPETGGPEGLHVLAVVLAAIRSAEEERPVMIQEIIDESEK